VILEDCVHAPFYEKIDEYNQETLQFLQRQAGAVATWQIPNRHETRNRDDHEKKRAAKSG